MIKVELFVKVIVTLIIVNYSNGAANYGPFKLTMTKISFCNGPKKRQCAVNTAKIVDGTILVYDMNVTENIKDLRGNLFAISENKQTIRLQMKRLCDHPFWMPFMQKYVNITKNCVILKGYYHMEANAQETAQKYYAGSFVYGKWIFRSVMYTKDCNFGCSNIEMSLTPKI